VKFRVHQYKDLDLTIHEATEQIDIHDIISVLEDFYRSRVTTYLIWDLNRGGNPDISKSDIQRIIDFSIEYGSIRKDVKSAIVTDVDLYYGLSRMFELHSEIVDGLTLHFRVFRNLKEAIAWFGINSKDSWVPY
jgi:hypothetical protein